MFRAHVLIIRRSKLHYTASGIITPINIYKDQMYYYNWVISCDMFRPLNGRNMSPDIAYIDRCDDTRGCVKQFWPPDDEHMCSKHVDAWNKLIVKQKVCASSWLITEINSIVVTTSQPAPPHIGSDWNVTSFNEPRWDHFQQPDVRIDRN